jgi:hypothetical protein
LNGCLSYDFAMAITDDEKKQYLDFALELAKELKSLSVPPDAVLWHYTTGPSLIAIFETMSLYSTQLSCLNDSTELRYASRHFRQAMLAKRATITAGGTTTALLDGALEYFKENPDFPYQAVAPQLVTCFSEERDDLSQWRAYGSGENGYAIGFKARYLWGVADAVLIRVNYDAGLHATLAQWVVDAMVDFFLGAVAKHAPVDMIAFGKEFLYAWDAAIVSVAPLIKDAGFGKEQECRIVKGFQFPDLAKLRFLQKSTMMSRHLPLQPPAGNAFTPYRLPIDEVMVGPCRHPQISRTTVNTLLQQKGYPDGLVSISKIPFQST